jgi:hypothetical protein
MINDIDRQETENRVRALAGSFRALAEQYRRTGEEALARVADDLIRAAAMADKGVIGTSPALSTVDSFMVLVAPIRDAAARWSLISPLDAEQPAPTAERIPDMVPATEFGPSPIAAKPEGKRAKP